MGGDVCRAVGQSYIVSRRRLDDSDEGDDETNVCMYILDCMVSIKQVLISTKEVVFNFLSRKILNTQ